MSRLIRSAVVSFLWICCSSSLIAYEHSDPSASDPYERVLRDHAEFLNELSNRRRVNTLFQNEQSVFYGLQFRFVNSSRGNLTFVRRDLVSIGRVPIVVGRVYDSMNRTDAGFGPGWRLSLMESVSESSDNSFRYVDDSGSEIFLERRGSSLALLNPGPTNLASATISDSSLEIVTSAGWSKSFRRINDRYLLESIRDGYGNELTLHYAGDKLARVLASNGRFVAIEWNTSGQISHVIDDQGRKVAYQYDDQGLLRVVIDIGGNEWRCNYDEHGRLRRALDPQGVPILEVQSDERHRATAVRLLGSEYRYRYENARTIIQDEAGRTAFALYNQFGITTSLTSATGFTSEIRFDEQNRVTALVQNFKPKAAFSYGADGLLETLVRHDEGGAVTFRYNHDDSGRVTDIVGSDGSKTNLTYNVTGDLLRRQSDDHWVQYEYSGHGDLRRVVSNHGSTEYTHNADGQIEAIAGSQGNSRLRYFPNGRLQSITFADGSIHEFTYNLVGLRESVTRSNNKNMTYDYDPAGNLIRAFGSDASGRNVGQSFEIDRTYRARVVRHDSGHITRVAYDTAGNPETISRYEDPTSPVLSYTYDARNRLVAVADGEKIIGSYVYQGTEADLRDQLDHHTMRVAASNGRSSATLGSLEYIVHTRPYGSPFGSVAFDEATQSFELSSPIGVVLPDLVRNSGIHRQELSGIEGGTLESRVRFDRPSNIAFLPPEYATINCAQNCVFYGVEIRANGDYDPITVSTGTTVTLAAGSPQGTANQGCQNLICDWTIGGQPAGLGKTISRTFLTPGTYHVVTSCECSPCDITGGDDTFVDVIDPVCSVDYSVAPTSPKITTAPAMPSISASVTAKSPANASISWSASISHTAPSGCSGGPTFSSNTVTGSGATFTPMFSGIFGGEMTIRATCSAPGYQSKTTTKKINVGGTQPSDTLIGAQIGTVGTPFDSADLRRIGCHESNLTQFTGANAFPLYGGGGDTGIMQICFQRTSTDLWDWRANVERGRFVLMDMRARAQSCLGLEVSQQGATPYTNAMWRKEAIHRYNAGSSCVSDAYQEWDATLNVWIVVARGGAPGYLNNVLAKSATCT